MRLKICLFILSLIWGIKPALAGEPPILISPANNSTITSTPTFSWQAVPGSTGYNILIDDEPTVTSPYAKTPYYPTNPGYSPTTLNPGIYYWKVKTKDSNGTWGSFSSIWSFTLSTSTPTLTPPPTDIPLPTSTPAPTPALTPSSAQPTPSFTISDSPSQIYSNQQFNVSINLALPNNKNTTYYLSGAFKKVDGTRYFGLTNINSNWVPYNSSNYINQYKITTDGNGNWTGILEVKPDTEDSDYKGSGEYIFKVARYLSNSNPIWSNESTIKIISAENNQDEISINIPSPTSTPLQVKTSVPSPTKNYERLVYRIASVAAATASATIPATATAQISVKDQRQVNPMVWIGLICIFAGASSIGYIYFKKNGKIHF